MHRIPPSEKQLKDELQKQKMIDDHHRLRRSLHSELSFGLAVRFLAVGIVGALDVLLVREFISDPRQHMFVYLVLGILLLISIPAISPSKALSLIGNWTISRRGSSTKNRD